MEYEKKYKAALERAEIAHKDTDKHIKATIERIFPELCESEDERIRKAIIELLKEVEEDETYTGRQHIPDMLAYLEKQKEQKPVEWSDEDEKFFTTALWHISYSASNGKSVDWHCDTTEWLKSLKERFKSIRSSWKPSKDEERLINTSISFLKDFADKGYENAVECIDWLKSKLSCLCVGE